jgi:predicted nucleic acid-binding Zn ribbon protein
MTKPTAVATHRACASCGTAFIAKGNKKNCSAECSVMSHNKIGAAHQRRKYVKRYWPTSVDCAVCGKAFSPTNRSGMVPKYCSGPCRRIAGDAQKAARFAAAREAMRSCHRCLAPVPGQRRGIAVCDECRVDRRRVRQPSYERTRTLRKYGISLDRFVEMQELQNNSCGICGTNRPGGAGQWCVDHDHVTGQVRGLLCSNCNLGIGLLGDDPDVIARAAAYVRSHRQLKLIS